MVVLIRFAAILITAIFYLSLISVDITRTLSAVAISHYLVAFYMSRKNYKQRFVDVFKNSFWSGIIMLGIFVASICMAFASKPSIVLVFGLHHVLSEVYLINMSNISKELLERTLSWRILINAAVYLIFIYLREPLQYAPYLLVIYCVILAVVLTWLALTSAAKRDFKSVSQLLLFEYMAILCLLLFVPKMVFQVLIFYHVVIWLIIPFMGPDKRTAKKALYIQMGLWGLVYLVAPYLSMGPHSRIRSHNDVTVTLGYVHIVTSLFVSKFNPQFLQRFLK